MSSSPTETPQSSQPAPPRHERLDFVLKLLMAVIGAAAVVWFFTDLLNHPLHLRSAVQRSSALQAAMILIVACIMVFRFQHRWRRPMNQLRGLIEEARSGQAPIEELSKVGGEIAPLVPLIQDLLRDVRGERRINAELQDEIRQRVANKTDAMERAIRSLRRQATQDRLTGLYNRRMFDEFLPKIIERCQSGRPDLGVLMIDIDHFKLLNDTLGHAAGDELLRDIGKLMRSTIRENDAAFRLGGDEFVLLVPGAELTALCALRERLMSLIERMTEPMKVPTPPKLSIGITQLSESPETTPQALLERADQRLYEVKRANKAAFAHQATHQATRQATRQAG